MFRSIMIPMSEQLFFNGINAVTGESLFPPIESELLASLIAKGQRDTEQEHALATWWRQYASPSAPQYMAAREGTDYLDLASAGWGAIFPYDIDVEIIEALRPLLEWRKLQAGELYKEYTGPDGYRYKVADGMFETKNDWLARHGMGPGPADPKKVPYYLLVVGDPDTIPYHFQIQLDVQYAVGRIYFDTILGYATYANSVVSAEKDDLSLGKQATFFGVANPDDLATKMSATQLIAPLARSISEQTDGWNVQSIKAEAATKSSLTHLLKNEKPPALLFAACHGMGFPNGHPLQQPDQGALLCQDWPGPREWAKPISKDFYFAADDLTKDVNVQGMVAFAFVCYGAGTPHLDEFSRQNFRKREEIAPKNFIARLAQQMLSHPKGGALAWISHVERAWGYSFLWGQAGTQLTVFESTLKRLMDGYPVGYAFEYFNNRYAELASTLSDTLDEIEFGRKVDPIELTGIWTATKDARNYVILGDPFVKLMVKEM